MSFSFRKMCLLLLIICAGFNRVYSQDDLCDAVTTIMRDAPNKFRNIRGNVIQSDFGATTWNVGIKVPGTMSSRFVSSMGLFYEGAFLQTAKLSDVRGVYEKYRDLMDKCLTPIGYKRSVSDNFYPGLGEYKKIAFMPEIKTDAKPGEGPSHAALEVIYNKDIKKYTVVMYIFEH